MVSHKKSLGKSNNLYYCVLCFFCFVLKIHTFSAGCEIHFQRVNCHCFYLLWGKWNCLKNHTSLYCCDRLPPALHLPLYIPPQ